MTSTSRGHRGVAILALVLAFATAVPVLAEPEDRALGDPIPAGVEWTGVPALGADGGDGADGVEWTSIVPAQAVTE